MVFYGGGVGELLMEYAAGELRRRARSWPFDTLFAPVKCNFRALSDAPIRIANGHDLQPFLVYWHS